MSRPQSVLRIGDRVGRGEERNRALARALARRIEGEVRFGELDRSIYSTDAGSYRQLPIGVVLPRHVEDIVETVRTCREHDVPILVRGGGTSLAGQGCNEAVVIDCSKYLDRVLEIDRLGRRARVEPGVVLDDLRSAAESGEPRLTFGPDPSTHDHCTLGGMIGNNSCGAHSVQSEFYGPGPRTEHNVEELEILTYDGLRMRVGPTPDDAFDRIVEAGGRRAEIYTGLRRLRDRFAELIRARYPTIPRRVSGYNLDQLLPENGFDLARALVGTESTCVVVSEATLSLIDSPPARAVALLGFRDVYAAADAAMIAREHRPLAIEGFDDVLVEDNVRLGAHVREIRMLPRGRGWLLVEVGGDTQEEADARLRPLIEDCRDADGFVEDRIYDDPAVEQAIWKVRESGLGATAFTPGRADTYEGWEDSAVPPERLATYLRELRELYGRYGYSGAFYGHFGQGCIHTRIDWDPGSEDGIASWRGFLDEAANLVVSHGGSLSGEHGDGQSRGELLERMFGAELVQAFREFKSIWDPGGRMNPGKVVDARPITTDLRLGPSFAPQTVSTRFSYPRDRGSFAHATARCVGIGECRRIGGQTMCPSYMVTREEEHSTRGRARVLFEMLRRPELGRWRSDEVKEALDLCLSCKGCKVDCPVNVDMATYKAEFLSHFYEGRVRPRAAYAMGLIPWWARLAARAPRLANAVSGTPIVSSFAKRAAGVAPQRALPRFAETTMVDVVRGRQPVESGDGRRVIVWPDTFTNHFHPEVGIAAIELLRRLGFDVSLPDVPLCCGRPLYDYGMLTLAKRFLGRVLAALRPEIRAGVPVVGLEPSCVAVFRDELPALLTDDPDAERLSAQTFVLSEFLEREAAGWHPGPIGRRALLHVHCHHRAVLDVGSELAVLERLGVEARIPEPGCCGMAGSFGFERGDRYEVSVRIGERALLPAVREADPDTLVVADGFSCRTQIEQGTGHRPMHLAELALLALQPPSARDPARQV